MIGKFKKTAAILCCITSILCFATVFGFQKSEKTSYAEPGSLERVETTSLFTPDSYAVHTFKGIKVDTKEDDATLNGSLSGDFSLKYAYSQAGYGETEFVFYDKDEPAKKVFSLYRSFSSENLGSACVVDYRGAEKEYYILGNRITGTLNVYFCNPSANTADKKEVYPANANNFYGVEGELSLKWNGDSVSVEVSRGWNGAIEGSDVMATFELPGFKDGYIMRVEGSSLIRGKGGDTSILMTEMNGIKLFESTIEGVVTDGKISYEGEYVDDNGDPAINLTIGDELKEFVYTRGIVADCTENGFGYIYAETKRDSLYASASYADKAAGRYSEDIEAYGITKRYVVYVSDSYRVTTESLFKGNGGTAFTEGQGVIINTKTSAAEVNGVLSEDFSVKYEYSSANYGESEFAFYDKDDLAKKVFSVYRSFANGNYGCACVIDYREDTPLYIAGTTRNNINIYSWGYFGGSGGFGIASEEVYPSCGGWYNVAGEIKLTWTGDSVEIGVTVGTNGVVTETKTMATLNLPEFKDGYVMRIEPSAQMRNKNGHDGIILKTLNNVDLSAPSVTATLVGKDITNESSREVNGKQTIDVIKGMRLPEFTLNYVYAVAGMKISVPYEKFSSTADVSAFEAGEHTVSVSYKGVTRDFVINVGAGCSVSEIFSADSCAEYVQTESNAGVVKGVKVVPKNNPARFNGIFSGDLSLEYSYAATGYGAIRFDFYDKDQPSRPVFSVYRSRYTTQTGMQTFGNAFVIYEEKYYVLGNAYDTVDAAEEASKNYNFYPANNAHAQNTGTDKWAIAGQIHLEWAENAVSVKLSVGAGAVVTGEVTMATLTLNNFSDGYTIGIADAKEVAGRDYADQVVLLSVNGKSFAEPFMQYEYLPVGVTYSGVMKDGVIYIAQNGDVGEFGAERGDVYYADGWYKESVSLDELKNSGLEFDYSADFSTVGSGSLSVTPILNGKRGESVSFSLVVEPSAKIILTEKDGTVIDTRYYSENTWQIDLPVPQKENWKFGGWYDENGELTERLEDFEGLVNMIFIAHWYDDVAPEISLSADVQDVTKELGELLADLNIAASDVNAYDSATNRCFNESEIKIFVKEPNGESFIALENFAFDNVKYGVYVIRYEVTDDWLAIGDAVNNMGHNQNNTAYVERVIYYAAERPEIEVNGDVAEISYIGVEVNLPVAVAKRGNENLETLLRVSFVTVFGESEEIELRNGAFTPVKEGVYSVVYYAIDDCGQTASKRYTMQVIADSEKPVIEVSFTQKTAHIGETVNLPAATATDAVDGELPVVVEVWFNNRMIANGAFEPEEEGLYVIRYIATDRSGNKCINENELVVAGSQADEQNDNAWIYIVVSAVAVIAIGIAAAIIVGKKIKK